MISAIFAAMYHLLKKKKKKKSRWFIFVTIHLISIPTVLQAPTAGVWIHEPLWRNILLGIFYLFIFKKCLNLIRYTLTSWLINHLKALLHAQNRPHYSALEQPSAGRGGGNNYRIFFFVCGRMWEEISWGPEYSAFPHSSFLYRVN